ncbi:MAG TPA: SDR family oxidoreductase [Terriglobales bacterium]|nr:SDR family oxidoreductase [Terriglobales bacterium]
MSRVAVITGASSGIGLLAAVEMARRGYTVVGLMRDLARRTRLDEAAAVGGVKIDVRCLDVTDFARIPQIVGEIVRDHGRIDVLVNNAGFAMAGFLEDILLEELRQQFETNFFGVVAMTRAVLPTMRAQRSGHIIMVSSVSGRVGELGIGSYSASKFALEGWSEALRVECRTLGIHVALVEPGSFRTDIWDRNARIGKFALDRSSPNHQRGARFTQFIKSHLPTQDATPVAKLIADIAEKPQPRLRYVIGKDAFLLLWLRRLLPWKSYEKVVLKVVGVDR